MHRYVCTHIPISITNLECTPSVPASSFQKNLFLSLCVYLSWDGFWKLSVFSYLKRCFPLYKMPRRRQKGLFCGQFLKTSHVLSLHIYRQLLWTVPPSAEHVKRIYKLGKQICGNITFLTSLHLINMSLNLMAKSPPHQEHSLNSCLRPSLQRDNHIICKIKSVIMRLSKT